MLLNLEGKKILVDFACGDAENLASSTDFGLFPRTLTVEFEAYSTFGKTDFFSKICLSATALNDSAKQFAVIVRHLIPPF